MISFIKRFLALEAASGLVLCAGTIAALMLANSPYEFAYKSFLNYPLGPKSITHWISDGLMAIFFLLIGLEVKREIVSGALSSWGRALLPLIAALGGVIMPAIIYSIIHWNTDLMRGWAIPTATDIAFSLGVLALLGSRIPSSLKIFLMALAVIDDIAAIVIIALFYTAHISAESLALAAACALIMLLMSRRSVTHPLPYLTIGFIMWGAFLNSGIHPTIAGVVLGFLIPLPTAKKLIERLHPWVAYGIMPVFAFANAGINLQGITSDIIFSSLPLSIMLALFFGKQLGIFLFSFIAVKLRIASLPLHMNWRGLYGVSIVAGIGFTMSLFIGELAFSEAGTKSLVTIGVIGGSLLSALCGYAILLCIFYKKPIIRRS